MKKLFLIVFLIISANSFSQRFDGYCVTINNDTIRCKFFVEVNLVNKTMLNPCSVTGFSNIRILTESGEKKKYNTRQVKTIFIPGTDRGDYTFVTVPEEPTHFYHRVTYGKISKYKLYELNLDGQFPHSENYIGKEKLFIGLDDFTARKELEPFLSDYPDLKKRWMDKEYKFRDLDEVIALYNAHFENK